ncbi:MAG: DUF4012 domain-containing protein [Chloroflexi bacterium]|nr:DUF4012 domain-containing protein [Chloroflexota bacterium]
MARPPKAWVIIFLVALAITIGAYGYWKYTVARGALQRVEAHVRNAEAVWRDANAQQAGIDIDRIQTMMAEINATRQDVGLIVAETRILDPILLVASYLPGVGGDARAIRHLLRMADPGLQAWDGANEAQKAVFDALTKPGDTQSTQRMLAAAQAAYPGLEKISRALRAVQDEYSQIPRDGLHPGLARPIALLGERLLQLAEELDGAREGARLLPVLLGVGEEKTYLVLLQDSGEIRPTGGFIGNYGIIGVSNGHISRQQFADVYTLDWPYYYSGKSSPPASMFARYMPESTFWALRDSNIWPDFPTSAKQAAQFAVEEGATDRIDGVIAITPALASRLLRVLGPLTVPQFGEMITADNLEERIRYFETDVSQDELRRIIGTDENVSRKVITSLLVSALIEQIEHLDLNKALALGPALRDAVRAKDLLVYLAEPQAQRTVERFGAGGEAKPSPGDYLWIVDMNLSVGKDNLYVQQAVQYSVTVGTDGGAIADLSITYDYRNAGDLYLWSIMRGYYGDFLRVYVPPGSRLIGSEGSDEPVATTGEHGKTVFETFLKVYPKTMKTMRLRYWIPLRVWRDDPVTKYQLLIQRQPATNIKSLDVQVILPDGSTVKRAQRLSGESKELRYRGTIDNDLSFEVDFKLPGAPGVP